MIRPEKQIELKKRMDDLQIYEKDLEETFILASKKGGQNVQKTSSCVHLKHLPTGLIVKCQKERERETNRFLARRVLCDLYEEKILKIKTKKMQKQDKIKKQKSRRKRRSTQG
jgi:protein subunit release factor B